MATHDRPADRGRRKARELVRRLGQDHRQARVAAGLSLRVAAAASQTSQSRLWRFEHGLIEHISMADVGAWCAVVGLDVALRGYPSGDPLRDRAQQAVLERLRVRLHRDLIWRTEVAVPIVGDLRAWDGAISGERPAPWSARVEAETNISDGQALERRLRLKLRDDPVGHLILLVADTRNNRAALKVLTPGLQSLFTVPPRRMLAALSEGLDPGGNGSIVL
ncbi:MAG TPA: helix-turn-helix transcriptional regulator [Candidatus Limnocylindrales bacterium]|nr:helix-turn-helix transcriptional regulator [Candidatus Limnocylindrales bacterium]